MKTELIAVPKASPDPLPELDVFLAPFAPQCRRDQSRASADGDPLQVDEQRVRWLVARSPIGVANSVLRPPRKRGFSFVWRPGEGREHRTCP
ncbi:MAG: hypothetical protein HY689_11510 [Chloroflexi bacterium]|nr:hypothetical protein [Chloroflexota bacterium]